MEGTVNDLQMQLDPVGRPTVTMANRFMPDKDFVLSPRGARSKPTEIVLYSLYKNYWRVNIRTYTDAAGWSVVVELSRWKRARSSKAWSHQMPSKRPRTHAPLDRNYAVWNLDGSPLAGTDVDSIEEEGQIYRKSCDRKRGAIYFSRCTKKGKMHGGWSKEYQLSIINIWNIWS